MTEEKDALKSIREKYAGRRMEDLTNEEQDEIIEAGLAVSEAGPPQPGRSPVYLTDRELQEVLFSIQRVRRTNRFAELARARVQAKLEAEREARVHFVVYHLRKDGVDSRNLFPTTTKLLDSVATRILSRELTAEQKGMVANILKLWFPWIDEEDGVSGADVVDRLSQLYQVLR